VGDYGDRMTEDGPLVLSPRPEAVVETITKIVAGPWPTTEADRRALFSRVAFADRRPEPGRHEPGQFSTALADDVDGYWSTFGGEFLGLNLFLYLSPDEANPTARAGYDRLRLLLPESFGAPIEEWGPAHMPASAWTIQGLLLSMYCHAKGNSCVQLGLEHAERSAANDAAHAAAERP
jgi:hypothetical protein